MDATPVLVILRGLPGSGKSTVARGLSGVVCSADDYFVWPDGVYRFDPSLISAAHAACYKKAAFEMASGFNNVVLDNTNTQFWEFDPYIQLAEKHGYSVRIHNVFDGGLSDSELADRNQHGVPVEAIARMRARWEELPR